MNKLIQNLAQISDAAEYFDKKTGAAWKIRSALTNMVVWAANSHLYAQRSGNAERITRSMVELATLRNWAQDSTCNAFVLDLTPSAVRRTLGLERQVDVHEEAVRTARQKCRQVRSALHFQKYYDAAVNAFDEQRRNREEAVESICNLLADNDFVVDSEVASHFETFMNLSIVGDTVSDRDLYDDGSVERQSDQLAEVVGNALEAMYDVCEAELSAAITESKISRLMGYHKAINNMLVITGVDMTKLAARRVKLEALIDAQAEKMNTSVADIDAQIDAQLAAPTSPAEKLLDHMVKKGLVTNEEIVEALEPKKLKRVKKVKSLAEINTL